MFNLKKEESYQDVRSASQYPFLWHYSLMNDIALILILNGAKQNNGLRSVILWFVLGHQEQ